MATDPMIALALEQLNDAFRPAGPADQEHLFSGRSSQRERIAAVASTPGQHGVIFGERGVGKTSLAAISVRAARARDIIAVRVNCSPDDDFQLIWDAVVDQVVEQRDMPWWKSDWDSHVDSFLEIMGRDSAVLAEPDRVRLALSRLSQAARVLVFFDEYDQVEDEAVSRFMASTIKTLSDHLVEATIVVVGVAADIEELIEGHQSIQRCLYQVHMPRMSQDEIEVVVTRGLGELNMGAAPSVIHFIQRTALGFPQYAHLLGKSFARCALKRGSHDVVLGDLECAINDAVEGVEQSSRADYNEAVFSSHANAIYKSVLAACALAQTDTEGFFAPRDLQDDLSIILDRKVRSDTYNRHLEEFCDSRGPILERRGQSKRWRYRFRDPAMAPYVVLMGTVEGLIIFAPGAPPGDSTASEQELPFEP